MTPQRKKRAAEIVGLEVAIPGATFLALAAWPAIAALAAVLAFVIGLALLVTR